MNFQILLKFSEIQYHYNRSHSSEEHRAFFCRDVVTAAAERMPAHAWRTTFGGSIPELQNVAEGSLTCRCWVFLWPRRSAVVVFQSELKSWMSNWNSVWAYLKFGKIREFKKFLKLIKSGFSIYGSVHIITSETKLSAATVLWTACRVTLFRCTTAESMRTAVFGN